MKLDRRIQIFDEKQIRTFWDSEQEKWFVSITDVIAVLTESIDPNAYWNNLKAKLKKEGNETVTNCHTLKTLAADGKMRIMDIELEGAPEKVKNLLFNFSNDSFERVSLTKEAQELGQMYVNEKVVGQTSIEDCYHIAMATINNVNVLV